MTAKYEPESEWLLNNMGSPFSTCWIEKRVLFNAIPPTYVDLGCSHPHNKSLTSLWRELGWRGLAIDGNHDYANDWAQAGHGRDFVCAVLSDQPTARFVVHNNSFTSRISEIPERDHPERWGINRVEDRSVIPLNHLLETHDIGKIDLLCTDLEGKDFDVLMTLDWEKHSPAWVIAEFISAGDEVDPRLPNLLLQKGYEVVQMFPSNLIFRRKS